MRSNHKLRRIGNRVAIELLEPRICLSAVSFLPAASYNAPNARAVAVGDFNGDGWPDLAVLQLDSVSIWLNQQNGAFAMGQSYSIPLATGVAVGDFNHDGASDLVVTSGGFASQGLVNILFGNGDGTFLTTPQSIAVGTKFGGDIDSPVVGEFNAFGRADVAVVQRGDPNNGPTGSGRVIVLLNNGDGTFATPVNYSVGNLNGNFANPTAIALEDYNGDHALDLAVSVSQLQFTGTAGTEVPGFVSLLYGNTQPDPNDPRAEIPDGTFTSPSNSAAGVDPESLTTADYNGDGAPDVATANEGNTMNPSNVSLYLNDGGGSMVPSGTLIAGSTLQAIVSADFDGNGTSDLAVAGTSGLRVRTGNGDGTFALSQTISSGYFSQMVVGDFNRDGQPDLAVGNAGGFSILLNKSKSAIVPSFSVNDGSAPRSMVKSLTVTFNEPVTIDPGGLVLQTSGGANVPFQLKTSDNETYVLTFSESQFAGGSLTDGRYVLSVEQGLVHDGAGQTFNSTQSFNFFRLFGDFDGNGTVNNADYLRFKKSYLTTSSDPAYLSLFDYDSNGMINNFDFLQFKKRYLMMI